MPADPKDNGTHQDSEPTEAGPKLRVRRASRASQDGRSRPSTQSPKLEAQNSLIPHPFPVVGIGASAGGIEALQVFFQHMPADSGMAFVVVLHLSPNFDSNLAAIL